MARRRLELWARGGGRKDGNDNALLLYFGPSSHSFARNDARKDIISILVCVSPPRIIVIATPSFLCLLRIGWVAQTDADDGRSSAWPETRMNVVCYLTLPLDGKVISCC